MSGEDRIALYEKEHPDRSVWGTLSFDEVCSYLKGADEAPSAQEVFDHYWSILNYAFSDELKEEILALPPEEGVKRLLALGGGVWNTYVTVDLLEPYSYEPEDLELEGNIDGYRFVLPKRPFDLLLAGDTLGRDQNEQVLEQHDFPFCKSILVYDEDEVVDILNLDFAGERTIDAPFYPDQSEKQPDEKLDAAEERWAEDHSLKWVPTYSMSIGIGFEA